MSLVICEQTGRPLYEETDDIKTPVDYSFESINDFVHCSDVQYEELQYCCLGMATEMEKLNAELKRIQEWYARDGSMGGLSQIMDPDN